MSRRRLFNRYVDEALRARATPNAEVVRKETEMRVLILAKEGDQSAAPTPPTPEAMAEFQKYNQELVKAGVVIGDGRLYPRSQGRRVRFGGKKRTVTDGAFVECQDRAAGHWL